MNYYELFDLPISPWVDQKLISKKYIELQRKSHPDFYQNSTESEKEEIMLQSAEINKGYKIFKDEQLTIEYFLTIHGVINSDEKYNLPSDFLMEMMELNESILSDETVDTEQKVKAYESDIIQPIVPLMQQQSQEWVPADLQKMKEYYYKKKYLERILDRLED